MQVLKPDSVACSVSGVRVSEYVSVSEADFGPYSRIRWKAELKNVKAMYA